MSPASRSGKRPLADLLVENNLFESRDEAVRWIMAGQVLVNGHRIDKPGTPVQVTAELRVRGRRRYASRGGLKLEAALRHWAIPVQGRVALDCGASTGGFTDCLLQRGAALVYAVEVGFGQLAGKLRADLRVRNLERTNLGDLRAEALDPRPSLITLDLSYLSLTQALPLASGLLSAGGEVVALFKPLFEVDDPAAGRTGRIADPGLIVDALRRVLEAGQSAGLQPLGAVKLGLRPRHGVPEYMLYLTNSTERTRWQDTVSDLERIVSEPGIDQGIDGDGT
ncbi:MAG TPA: TlyA family RNA methyltransferase [Chloroflexota bacterium]|nr:TlyA family RNA methyltransferase [Chloroflexota bacterium]